MYSSGHRCWAWRRKFERPSLTAVPYLVSAKRHGSGRYTHSGGQHDMWKVLENGPSFLMSLRSVPIWELITDRLRQVLQKPILRAVRSLSLGWDLDIFLDGNQHLRLILLRASEVVLSFVETDSWVADTNVARVILNETDRATQLSEDEFISLRDFLVLGFVISRVGFDGCHDRTKMCWGRNGVLQ